MTRLKLFGEDSEVEFDETQPHRIAGHDEDTIEEAFVTTDDKVIEYWPVLQRYIQIGVHDPEHDMYYIW